MSMSSFVRNSVLLLAVISLLLSSCEIQKRLYRPGFHMEGRWMLDEVRSAKSEVDAEWQGEEKQTASVSELSQKLDAPTVVYEDDFIENTSPTATPTNNTHLSQSTRSSSFVPRASPLDPDTLKKPFQSAKQYREVDPVGEYAVVVVLAGVALQKIAGILTWFEVIMPLSFGPGIFIPAFVVALIGLGISAYSAYRVRKFPEKYRKNEWGKAALAILGWQVLMSALFAWLLGGLPIL